MYPSHCLLLLFLHSVFGEIGFFLSLLFTSSFYNLVFLFLFLFLVAKFLFIVRFLLRFILELSCQSCTHISTIFFHVCLEFHRVSLFMHRSELISSSPFREEKNPPTLRGSFRSFAFSSRFFNEKKKKRETVAPFSIRFHYILVLYLYQGSLFPCSVCLYRRLDTSALSFFRVSCSLLSQYFRSLM